MGILLIYTLKSAFCLTLFYLLYKWALADETFFRLNRGLLLAFWPLALLLPAIPLLLGKEAIATAALPGNELETVNTLMTTHGPRGKSLEQLYGLWLPMACVVYLAGVIALSAKTLIAYFRLRHLIRSGRRIEQKAFHLVLVEEELAPFSWMRYIVISEKDYRDNPKEILTHERAHIRHHHSWDLILADVFIAWQWFNPAAWLLKREMRAVHEYEADDAVLSAGIEARSYQMLLIKKAVGSSRYTLANSFNHSTLKKRITMMLKEKSNPWARLKYLYVLPLAAIAVTAFARPEISGKVDVISAVKVNDFVQIVGTKVPEKKVEVLKDTVKKDAPKEEALKMPFSIRNAGSQPQPLILVDGKEITGEQMQRDINPDMIESISVLKDEASTAIYGDKAKHGVILITLKGKDVQNVLSLSASDSEDGVKVVGVVKDHLDKPLAGASVFISGTVSGTMSDVYGRFVLLAPKNAMLRISYTGMTTVEKAVAPEVNVTLNPAD